MDKHILTDTEKIRIYESRFCIIDGVIHSLLADHVLNQPVAIGHLEHAYHVLNNKIKSSELSERKSIDVLINRYRDCDIRSNISPSVAAQNAMVVMDFFNSYFEDVKNIFKRAENEHG